MPVSISTHQWTTQHDSEAIRTIMDLSMLYESAYKHSLFKKFIETGLGYTPGFAVVLHDDLDNRIGILLGNYVEDEVIHGGLRKRKRHFDYAGNIETPMSHNFRPVAEVGMYIKPDSRGHGLSKILLQSMEAHVLPECAKNRSYTELDIPIFQFYDPAFDIAVCHLKYSRPVRSIIDNAARRNDLHEWSNCERPINKYDEYARFKSIKSWSTLAETKNYPTDLSLR